MISEASMNSVALQEVCRKRTQACMEWEVGPQFNKATKHMLSSKYNINFYSEINFRNLRICYTEPTAEFHCCL